MADEVDQNALINEFTSVTGSGEERSRHYLEASGWNIQFALSTFYDNDNEESMEDLFGSQYEQKEMHSKSPERAPPSKSKARFGTIAGITDRNKENDDSSDEEGQTFYAGGSETSGQQILGPSRKNRNLTQSIFNAAKSHGAEVVNESQETRQNRKKKIPAFAGSGFRLGASEGLSATVQSSSNDSDVPEPLNVNLYFWSNGFSIDDGPLRDFNDPQNMEFLDSIKRGEIPRELLHLNRGGEVHVNMNDKRHEDYVKRKETMKAFTGKGHYLGSPTPNVVTPSVSTAITSSVQAPNIDEAQPITSLQIRLIDGTRLVGKFNYNNSIADVRHFVNASRPQMTSRDYIFLTTFPKKELKDETTTLEEAQLLNAVVVQKLT
ncbi:NSFL1 cofactor p47-like [Xenia sp. Carnegie-2017]|uniref:NSFL1 cofactor p47-like n=1 Tax=Xenia sp. Carnegie-2017 TaxID=2897299 RepID=UPI001F050171|nr:NSFL1 cofactor p47-like [Xenia sp. Carnegie-2017]